MPRNNLANTHLVGQTVLAMFTITSGFCATSNRMFQPLFGATPNKIGATMSIRLPGSVKTVKGEIFQPQALEDKLIDLKIDEFAHTGFTYTQSELTLSIEDAEPRYIRPAVQSMVQYVENVIANKIIGNVYLHMGTPGTPLNNFSVVRDMYAYVQSLGISWNELYLALSPFDASSLQSALQNNFNKVLNTDISLDAQLGRLSGFDIFVNQSIVQHVGGTLAKPTPSTVIQVVNEVSAGNVLQLKGFVPNSTGVLKRGDLLEVGKEVDYLTMLMLTSGKYKPSKRLVPQFVVQGDAITQLDEVNSNAQGIVNIRVNPNITTDPSNSSVNLSAPIPANATVSIKNNYTANIAYNSSGLFLAAPPLDPLDVPYSAAVTDPDSRLSLSIQRGGDIYNNLNAFRMNVMFGTLWNPENAVLLLS